MSKGKIWVIDRYAAGKHVGTVCAYGNLDQAQKALPLLHEKNSYESYLIIEVPFIEGDEQRQVA